MTKNMSTRVGFYDRREYAWEPFAFHGAEDDILEGFHQHVSRKVHHQASSALVAHLFHASCLVDLRSRIRTSYDQA